MATRTKRRGVTKAAAAAAVSAATGASWIALVAATTIGLNHVDRVRAEVRVETEASGTAADSYRLIVQCYAPESVGKGGVDRYARPLGSTQRAVTPEELRDGVAVDVLQLGEEARVERPVIVAWVEPGEPTLEYDALRARPSPDALIGVSEAYDASARIVLKRG
jgi:hypothetical protein